MYIVWKIQSANWSVPSLRYRLWVVFNTLRKKFKARIICSDQVVPITSVPDVVIFVKTLSVSDLIQAMCLKDMGVKIIYDLCDNLFYMPEYYKQIEDFKNYENACNTSRVIHKFLTISDCVVVPTATLRDCLLEVVPGIKRIEVFPDPVLPGVKEPRTGLKNVQYLQYVFGHGWRWACYKCLQILNALVFLKVPAFIFARFKFARLLQLPDYLLMKLQLIFVRIGTFLGIRVLGYFPVIMKIQSISGFEMDQDKILASDDGLLSITSPAAEREQTENPKQILWFGVSGREGLFGVSDLLVVKDELEALYKEVPFILTVVTENDLLFKRLIEPLMFRSEYIQWSEAVLENQLAKADVVIVPQSANKFSMCKSANRTLLALSRGTPVVASANPSLLALDGVVLIENWQANIKRCFQGKEALRHLLEEGKGIISREFTWERFVSSWEDLLISLNNK